MYKIAVLGDRQSVMGFGALGLFVYPIENRHEAPDIFKKLARSEQYAIIFVTEALSHVLSIEIEKYKDSPIPAVIIIPGSGGSQGLGLKALQQAVERAVGVDILNNG